MISDDSVEDELFVPIDLELPVNAEAAAELLDNLASTFPEENLPEVQSDHVEPSIKNFAVDEFIIVSFCMEQQTNKSRSFIGRILKIEDETLTVKFLSFKPTKNNNGYIYTYPIVDDIVEVKLEQVVRKLSPPKKVLRGALQFEIHNKDL